MRIGERLFTNLHYRPEDAGPRQNERYINEYLDAHPEQLAAFSGRRVICPANMAPNSETVHCYERAFTAEISRTGIVADNNRRFGSDNENPEVRVCRELCDEAKPGSYWICTRASRTPITSSPRTTPEIRRRRSTWTA